VRFILYFSLAQAIPAGDKGIRKANIFVPLPFLGMFAEDITGEF
jgi:hypothetical protein